MKKPKENKPVDFDLSWLDTYFKEEETKAKIKELRYARFKKWLKHNNFDDLMYRLILEHNQDYKENCYHKGNEPHPNNKLMFVIDYVVNNTKKCSVPELNNDCEFPYVVWCLKDYYFQMIWGQGVITNIYEKKKLTLLLQI